VDQRGQDPGNTVLEEVYPHRSQGLREFHKGKEGQMKSQERRIHENLTRLTFDVDQTTKNQVKSYAALEGQSVREWCTKILVKELRRKTKKGKNHGDG